jgi:hypothetical protein
VRRMLRPGLQLQTLKGKLRQEIFTRRCEDNIKVNLRDEMCSGAVGIRARNVCVAQSERGCMTDSSGQIPLFGIRSAAHEEALVSQRSIRASQVAACTKAFALPFIGEASLHSYHVLRRLHDSPTAECSSIPRDHTSESPSEQQLRSGPLAPPLPLHVHNCKSYGISLTRGPTSDAVLCSMEERPPLVGEDSANLCG